MQLKIGLVVALVSVLIPVALYAGDGYVGVYEDSLGDRPCAAINPYHSGVLYVIATLEGATSTGISGAEFRIEVSSPSGWLFSYTAPPSAAIALGNPMDTLPNDPNDNAGINLAFAECQTVSSNGHVRLGMISVFNLTGGPTDLSIKRHSHPSNSETACPLFTICDAPVFSKVCMSSAPSAWCINGEGPQKAAGTPDNDAAVYESNVYNNISGLVRPLPDSVPEAASWILKAFASGQSHVRGYVYATEEECSTLDELSDGIVYEAHVGSTGQLLIDWAGLHALSRLGHIFLPEPFTEDVAKGNSPRPPTIAQTSLFDEDFNAADAARVPSTKWAVTVTPNVAHPYPCYWGNNPYSAFPGSPFCSRYKDWPSPQSSCNSYGYGYDSDMDTDASVTLLL